MRFFMDYDNIPNKGPLMLFKDNGDGTSSLATPDDVNLVIAKATAHLQKLCEEQNGELKLLRDLILDDVPHQYQKRLLEVLDGKQ